MIAVPLIFGDLTADDYEDDVAADPRIDQLRDLMVVSENKQFSEEYLDADKRAIGNSIQVFYKDGSSSERIEVNYPIGHRRRRDEGIPVLLEKFKRNLEGHFAQEQVEKILAACENHSKLEALPVNDFTDLWVK